MIILNARQNEWLRQNFGFLAKGVYEDENDGKACGSAPGYHAKRTAAQARKQKDAHDDFNIVALFAVTAFRMEPQLALN